MSMFDDSNIYSPLERDLIDLYTNILLEQIGFSKEEAQKESISILNHIISESKNSGTYNLPQNFGDIILGISKSNNEHFCYLASKIQEVLHLKREDGVTDDDIRWHWNMHDVERRMLRFIDNIYKLHVFKNNMEQLTEADADSSLQYSSTNHPITLHKQYNATGHQQSRYCGLLSL